jgi:hypothetical protein
VEYDLIVFIKCSGPNVRQDNITDAVNSFIEKNDGCNYAFYITVDEIMKDVVKDIFKDKETLLELKVSEKSWAKDFNEFFDKYKSFTKWILISHDDVKFITDNYFESMMKEIEGHEDKIGWITSTSDYYYTVENRVVTDTFRAGFYNDFDKWGAMFQLHNMNPDKGARPDLELLDMPKRAVKVHGIMSAIMLVSVESLEKIGHCEDWTPYTMLIDEDWSLEALKNNLWNVWIPNVYHKHPNRLTLRPTNNKWGNQAIAGFVKKWRFYTGDFPNGLSIPVEDLREKYSETNIPWSTYRNSYDWEYIDE